MAKTEVKCRTCGKILSRDSAYLAGKGQYYCNEQEYELRNRFYALVGEYINTSNSTFYKELPLWGTDIAKLCGFIQDNNERLSYAMNKTFVSEYAKIRYFSAIIKNNINDYHLPKPEIIKECSNEFYDNKYKPKPRRKCLADYMEDKP